MPNVTQLKIAISATGITKTEKELKSVAQEFNKVELGAKDAARELHDFDMVTSLLTRDLKQLLIPMKAVTREMQTMGRAGNNLDTTLEKLNRGFNSVEVVANSAKHPLMLIRQEMTSLREATAAAQRPLTGVATRLDRVSRAASGAANDVAAAVRASAGLRDMQGPTINVRHSQGGGGKENGAGTATDLGTAGQIFTDYVSLPVLRQAQEAVNQASEYETAINLLRASAFPHGAPGAGGAEEAQWMAQLSAKAIALGNDLTLPGTSATDAAAAMLSMKREGIGLTDIMDGAIGVLRLSAAADVSNAEAAKIAAEAMNSFSLSGSQLTDVANILAAASDNSAANLDYMSEAIQNGGSAANMYKVDIKDFTAAMELLSQQGISAQVAGTSFKYMMSYLANPRNDKAAADIKKLGISLYDATGHVKPFRQVVDELSTSMGNLSEQERNTKLTEIFGQEASTAAVVFATKGTAAFDKFRGGIDKFSESAKELADARMKGLAGSFQGLRSQIETTGLKLATPFLPRLTDAVGAMGEFVGKIGGLEQSSVDRLLSIAGVAAAVGPMLMLSGAVTGLFTTLASPVGLAVLGAGGLAAIGMGIGMGALQTQTKILDAQEKLKELYNGNNVPKVFNYAGVNGDFTYDQQGKLIRNGQPGYVGESAANPGKKSLYLSGAPTEEQIKNWQGDFYNIAAGHYMTYKDGKLQTSMGQNPFNKDGQNEYNYMGQLQEGEQWNEQLNRKEKVKGGKVVPYDYYVDGRLHMRFDQGQEWDAQDGLDKALEDLFSKQKVGAGGKLEVKIDVPKIPDMAEEGRKAGLAWSQGIDDTIKGFFGGGGASKESGTGKYVESWLEGMMGVPKENTGLAKWLQENASADDFNDWWYSTFGGGEHGSSGTWGTDKGTELGSNIVSGIPIGIDKNATTATTATTKLADDIMTSFKTPLDIQSPSGVFEDYGTNLVEGLLMGIDAMSPMVGGDMLSLLNEVTQPFTTVPTPYDTFLGYGMNIGQGLVDGILLKLSDATDAGRSLLQAAEQGTKKEGEMKSPSKLFHRLGGFVAEGFTMGITAGTPMVHQAAADMLSLRMASGLLGGGAASVSTTNNQRYDHSKKTVTVHNHFYGDRNKGMTPTQARALAVRMV